MQIHCFQHLAYESPGSILDWAAAHGHGMDFTRFYEPDPMFPGLGQVDLLLVLGGFMNVDQEKDFPWLRAEKGYIRKAVDAGKKVLGICLGAQLIAAALGSKVYPAREKEIGFFPVRFSEAASKHPMFSHFSADDPLFHWHGDTFDLPAGARLMASTESCPNQAFAISDQVVGLQFHPEMTPETIEAMLQHDGHELAGGGARVQGPAEIRKGYHWLAQNKKDLFRMMDGFE
jgi:GMP synthase-like glutamine amidotransferase